jgi:hypothetical protein
VSAIEQRVVGEETLVATWTALAQLSAGASVMTSETLVTAVFPAWAPLNNAVMRGPADEASATAAAVSAADVFALAGIAEWALWVPSDETDFDAPREIEPAGPLTPDAPTLIMRADLASNRPLHDDVVATSVMSATAATDEPSPSTNSARPTACAASTRGHGSTAEWRSPGHGATCMTTTAVCTPWAPRPAGGAGASLVG